jgi:hypothetical protein
VQSRSVVSVPVRLHDDFNILIKRDEEAQKALNRKLPKFATQHLGNVGLLNAKKIASLRLLQPAAFHDRVDFENQLRLHQVLFGVRQANIFEHIPAPVFVYPLPHLSRSFAIRSASRRRRSINSISRRGAQRISDVIQYGHRKVAQRFAADPTQITGLRDGSVVIDAS